MGMVGAAQPTCAACAVGKSLVMRASEWWALALAYDNALLPSWVGAYVVFLFASTVWCKGALGTEDVAGSPRWTFGAALLTQCVVFPALTCALVSRAGGVDGLRASAAKDEEVAAAAVYAVYWAKDYVAPMSGLMALHHAACFAGLAVAFGVLERGRGTWLAAVMLFEAGSACMNVCELRPRERATVTLYVAGMAASNAAGLAGTYAALRGAPAAVAGPAAAATLVVAYFRQRQAADSYARGWDDERGLVL